ncbi:MAG: type III pantothenate kinase [bacterium]
MLILRKLEGNNLFIDIGNTNTKIFNDAGLLVSLATTNVRVEKFLDHIKNEKIFISSVVPSALERLEKELKAINKEYRVIDANSGFSFSAPYEDMGVDRLLAIEGALTLTKSSCAIVDSGSAITVELIVYRDGGAFLESGIIIPGFSLSLKALNDYTALLPLITPSLPNDFMGHNTNEAMNNGVCYSIVRGVEGIIDDVKAKMGLDELKLFVTGGAGLLFKNIASKDFTYVDDLMFRGMKSIANKEVNR